MKYLLILIGLLNFASGFAQTAGDAVTDKKYTVKERFWIMREKSQTFKEYKVIKETVLEGVWKILQDTLTAQKNKLRESKINVAKLQSEIAVSRAQLKQKEQSTKDIVYASTHINIMGVDFTKGAFASLVGIIILSLLVLLGVIAGNLRLMYSAIKERNATVDGVSREFEDYKHKAMEKQTKLSRELQNERNKLQELRSSSR